MSRDFPYRTLATGLMAATIAIGMMAAVAASANESASDDGRRMYRDGVLPSGKPLTAIVAGDVPVLGTQFSCQGCHGRSGMGGAEGAYIVPAIAGQFLFAASPQPARPAYDQDSLARLLRDGVTPGGRQLSSLMPRYLLSDVEIGALASYLAGLSSGSSPGVNEKVIRFATVVTEDVASVDSDAVFEVLRTFVAEKNSNTRLESERWDRGSTPASRLPTVHREWLVEKWQLTGPSETWNEQLEHYYRANPVFAMLGGMSNDSWGPVSRFCERNEIPCLFPGTDAPDEDAGDFYSLYFSRGLQLEAALIANDLEDQEQTHVIQVICGMPSRQAAAELRSLLEPRDIVVRDINFDCADVPSPAAFADIVTSPRTTVVLWLPREQVVDVASFLPTARLYLSASLLDIESPNMFPAVAGQALVAHPFRLPGTPDPALVRFKVWAKSRGIELNAVRRQSEIFFACLMLKDVIAHMGRFFIRDYLLDSLDHAQSMVAFLPFYPRPTLGPGQRFVNKGGYILPLVGGLPDLENATWIVP